MMSPTLTFAILFLQYIGQSEQVDCSSSGNCKVDINTLMITCPRYPENTACSCEPESDCDGLTYDSLEVDICKTKCSDADPTTCKFWKYMIPPGSNTKYCYFMDKDSCQSEDDDVDCPDNAPTDQHPICWSGAINRGDADDCNDPIAETTIAPAPTPPSPYHGTCHGPIDTTTGHDALTHYQLWDCWKPGNSHLEQVDMYTETEMPIGGYCDLIPETTGR